MAESYRNTSISINPAPPFDFALTASFATFFRGHYGAEHFENGLFHRLFDIDGRLCLATVSSKGTVENPALDLQISAGSLDNETISFTTRQITRILNLAQDLSGFYRMASSDPTLGFVCAFYGLHIPQTESIFEGVILAILGQQISYQVAFKLRTGLIQTYGAKLEAGGMVYHAFPSPAAIVSAGINGLRGIGFSTRKAEYVLDIAKQIDARMLDLESLRSLSDSEIVSRLTDLRGVGDWTAQWLLVRSFGRSDGFPVSDLALLRLLGIIAGKDLPLSVEEAVEYSQRWSPFRSYVTSYLFAAARSGQSNLLKTSPFPSNQLQ